MAIGPSQMWSASAAAKSMAPSTAPWVVESPSAAGASTLVAVSTMPTRRCCSAP